MKIHTPLSLLIILVILGITNGCAHNYGTSKKSYGSVIRLKSLQFKVVHGNDEMTCFTAIISGDSTLYYAVYNGANLNKLVLPPKIKTYSGTVNGVQSDRIIQEESHSKAQKVLAAEPVDFRKINGSTQDIGRSPLGIAPAFIIAAPFLSPVLLKDLFDDRNIIKSAGKKITLGSSWNDVIESLKNDDIRIDHEARVIRIGPGFTHRYKSAVIYFTDEKVSGIYTNDFYSE